MRSIRIHAACLLLAILAAPCCCPHAQGTRSDRHGLAGQVGGGFLPVADWPDSPYSAHGNETS